MVKVGDNVRFLNEVGGGCVVKVVDKRTVLVQTADGFEIPMLGAELVVVNNDGFSALADDEWLASQDEPDVKQRRQPTKPQAVQQPIKRMEEVQTPDSEGESISLHIALVPSDVDRLNATTFELYIINDSTYRAFYSVSQWNGASIKPLKSGIMLPDSKEAIKVFNSSEFSAAITLNIQAAYFKNIEYKAHHPEYFDFEINPIRMLKGGVFVENDYFEERAYVVSIADSQREELLLHSTHKAISESIKKKDVPLSKPMKTEQPEMVEVDLHIHELLDSWSGMTPGEIIQFQLAHFEKALQSGLNTHSTRRMVFIHGLGNGKLKFEITRLLGSKYPKLRYQDASFKEYGYGATLVYLK